VLVKTVVNLLFGLFLVALALAIAAAAIILGGRWFFSLPAQTITASSALVGVILVPVITYFTQRNLEKHRSRQEAVRELKTKFYDDTMRDLMRMFNIDKTKRPITPEQLAAIFAKWPAPMLTFASRGVILAWNNMRRVAAENDTLKTADAMENLFKAMRKDLGHSVFPHTRFEFIGVFVNDVETLEKPATPDS
jgi:hypothetical protein